MLGILVGDGFGIGRRGGLRRAVRAAVGRGFRSVRGRLTRDSGMGFGPGLGSGSSGCSTWWMEVCSRCDVRRRR